jgi:PKD repeat protein
MSVRFSRVAARSRHSLPATGRFRFGWSKLASSKTSSKASDARQRKAGAGLAVLALVASSLAAVLVTTGPASAVPATVSPIAARPPGAVTADALPTVQIDGVVWSQAIVGTGSTATVYAGGSFANARPAGAAAGTNLTPRSNLLAYNLSTGNLVTSFAPSLNAVVKTVVASPDGTRIYVGGNFTTADGGVTRSRIAAYSTATGALITTFKPIMSSQVNSIVATNTTVYVGGIFTSAAGQTRDRLAAFNASDGSLTAWNPNADANVNAMVLTPDGSRLIVGGAFQNVGGQAEYGLAAIDATTGAVDPWTANQTVRDAGSDAAIESLNTDGTSVFGTGYVYGAGGNLEGAFSAVPNTGAINWVESCHGDTYDSYPSQAGVVYVVSHEHFCGDVGGFQQTDTPWTEYRTTAFTTAATGTLITDNFGGDYKNWAGTPSPSLVNWYPDLLPGTYTGQGQAAWTVTGNSQYLVEGGEFPDVNSVAQQGLVRFAVSSIAPNKQGPRQYSTAFVPNLTSLSPTSVRVAFQSNWDRDDKTLQYAVYRNGNTTTPIWTSTDDSEEWNRPMLGFTDTGLTPGATYNYQVWATDPSGNIAHGAAVSITLPASGPTQSLYGQQVISDGAEPYLPMTEASGTTSFDDHAGYNDSLIAGTVTEGVAGPVPATTAATFDGSTGQAYGETSSVLGPTTFSVEAWFKTTTTKGGEIVGFGSAQTGLSQNHDRQIFMDNAGHLNFAVQSGNFKVVKSALTYNNGQWHQVVAELSSSGMALYIDGVRVASSTSATSAQTLYPGYWRVGGDNLAGISGAPSSNYLAGSIAQVSIYPKALTAAQVSTHLQDASSTATNVPPIASFTKSCTNLACTFNGSASTDSDGTIASYAWNFGDGTTATGATASHTYASAGSYTVALTVTDNGGATGSTANSVTVSAAPPNQPPVAAFTSTTSGLTASVNGSSSSDPDGTIASYAWTFGDGGTATGAAASHTYTAAGTYTVTLTVTDNQGATNAVSHSVTVSATNQPPVAAFTSTTSGLTASVNGSSSSDPDGTVASYAWTFGDGGTATGATASHTYTAAGTYTVTLTVTDNQGATNAVSHPVTVSVAAAAASDTFNRTVAGGWGSADVGGAWTVGGGAANFSVAPGFGKIQIAAGSGPGAYLNATPLGNTDSLINVSLGSAPTGGGYYVYLLARHSGTSQYGLKIKIVASGAVTAYLVKTVSGTETVVGTAVISGLSYTAGTTLTLRLDVSGTTSVSLQGKVWVSGQTQPTAWQVTATDASTPLGSGAAGVLTYLSGSATNAPVVASYSNLSVTSI